MHSEEIPKTAGAGNKVYLAVAGHYATNDLIFVQSLLALTLRTTVRVSFGFSADPSVERARNILTANFLASDCTHILFVDSDIGFCAEDVARICSHAGCGVVGGMYPLKNMNPTVQWCGNGKEGNGDAREDGLMEVKYIGTGFLCISREAFETLLCHGTGCPPAYNQDFPPHRREYAFWRQGVADNRFLTEDWMFCHQWLAIGGRIFADTRVVLKHAGRAEWPLPLQQGNPFTTTP
jgi:hypothetical protein